MIGAIFSLGNEIVEVRIESNQVLFRSSGFRTWATIEGLRLSKAGVIKEFPDLTHDDLWQEKAKERFKEKIKSFSNDKERMKYIIDDLKKFGYKPLFLQEAGHRPKKLT